MKIIEINEDYQEKLIKFFYDVLIVVDSTYLGEDVIQTKKHIEEHIVYCLSKSMIMNEIEHLDDDFNQWVADKMYLHFYTKENKKQGLRKLYELFKKFSYMELQGKNTQEELMAVYFLFEDSMKRKINHHR